MAIETQPSIHGFIATEPKLTYTDDGTARMYARIGIEHAHREDDGSFTQLDPTFHDMTIFRKTAEEATERLHKGDRFVASGRVHEYTYERDGHTIPAEEFIASRIGHDLARTRYDVDRTPRQAAVEREAPVRDASAFEAPASSQADRAPSLGL